MQLTKKQKYEYMLGLNIFINEVKTLKPYLNSYPESKWEELYKDWKKSKLTWKNWVDAKL